MSIQSTIIGFIGEFKSKASQVLFLDNHEYHCFNNVIVPDIGGTTQIDHIVVSKYGIFVVETKNKTGWIYGNTNDKQWTQTLGGQKYQFQNPLRQNYRHTKSLADFLGIGFTKLHSLVVFWGDCIFKTQMPDNVLNNRYVQYIYSKKNIVLSEEEVNKVCAQLSIHKKYNSTHNVVHIAKHLEIRPERNLICPECHGVLVERIVKNGEKRGQKFFGCANFPRCRYTRVFN